MNDAIGPLIIDFAGTDLSPEDREILAHPLVGGIILFSRNYASRAQLANLCGDIRKSSPAKALLIVVDQEGGRVQRFQDEFTRLPSMGTFGQLYDQNPDLACIKAKECGRLMAKELLTVGIDLSLAPVVDLNKGVNSMIGERAFHAGPLAVAILAGAFISGMKEAGMAAVLKHFPGHGSVAADSHLALPIDERRLPDILKDDLLPFDILIKQGVCALMAAHIVYPHIDSYPVTFSPYWLKKVLREELKFQGTVFSDDLGMAGANISADYSDRASAAREAGCDFILICNNRPGVIQTVDRLHVDDHHVSKEKYGNLICNQY